MGWGHGAGAGGGGVGVFLSAAPTVVGVFLFS